MICSSFKICKHISLYTYTEIKIQDLHMKENMEYSFQVWIASFDIITTSIHFPAKSWFHFSLRLKKIMFCICITFLSFICWWTSRPVHCLASWQHCGSKQKCKHLMVGSRELWLYAKEWYKESYPSSYGYDAHLRWLILLLLIVIICQLSRVRSVWFSPSALPYQPVLVPFTSCLDDDTVESSRVHLPCHT